MRSLACLASALLVAAATPAGATTFTQTYTGFVRSGIDGGDLFGGGNLAGSKFSAVYTFDVIPEDVFDAGVSGGSFTGQPSPLLSLVLTIKGHTYTDTDFPYIGSGTAALQYSDVGKLLSLSSSGFGEAINPNKYVEVQVFADADLGTASKVDVTVNTPTEFAGTADPTICTGFNCGFFLLPGMSKMGEFATETWDDTYPAQLIGAPAPEPATWAMMLLGLGGLGAVLRGRAGRAVVRRREPSPSFA